MFKTLPALIVVVQPTVALPGFSRSGCDMHQAHRQALPERPTSDDKAVAEATEWSRIAADTREWSKRTKNPYFVEAEHWGP
jgi:hypothetical protein